MEQDKRIVVQIRVGDFQYVLNHKVLPSNKIAGVSKFNDLIDNLSSQLTLQEKLTEIIAITINDLLECEGVFVRINAKHLCSDITNPKNSNFDIVTTYSTGLYEFKI